MKVISNFHTMPVLMHLKNCKRPDLIKLLSQLLKFKLNKSNFEVIKFEQLTRATYKFNV